MKRRKLTTEDRTLWTTVAKTVTPLRPDELNRLLANEIGTDKSLLESFRVDLSHLANDPALSWPNSAKASTKPLPSRLDKPTHQKISAGRVSIEARVDLHGLTQSQAHEALLFFLQRSYAEQRRHVLVITGKGSAGSGILRRAVPEWIKTPAFRPYVSGLDNAARHHGGDGALYIRLRKHPR
ncbi:Smr/MutS family protein [Limoniibacter endophyticus]|uniref:DNA mismatch repair protein MutS n=1 Tax=Limoniibacter endophyticus TaxID=1565040 RepID=A0A8J3GHF4_9HYPH|nr:Smr/MutS family protein [Limoniibacter endophyticus]GHC74451.1 DNA mismatch repair protein MutS [Limoniibacter endophyticus]